MLNSNEFTADQWIETLHLESHIEGGAFKETFRSTHILDYETLKAKGFKSSKAMSTHIYFLLKHGQFSAFHKIASDEHWHFYAGSPLTIYEINRDGELKTHVIGSDPANGIFPHTVVTAGNWFGSRCEVTDGFSLVGCTVAPGFDFEDFVLASRNELIALWPQHHKIIESLTYS